MTVADFGPRILNEWLQLSSSGRNCRLTFARCFCGLKARMSLPDCHFYEITEEDHCSNRVDNS